MLTRVGHIREFYTDQGVLPRLLFSQSEFAHQWLCFHLGVGHWVGIFVLLLLQAALGAALALGWHTKPALVLSWFLLNSLHARNPFVNDRGDLELVLLLFWGFFLPLEACWSADEKAGRPVRGGNVGWPAAAFILQIAMIYLFAGFLKYGDFWLVRGDGLFHSLQSPLFATPLAGLLATAPPVLLRVLNYGVIAGEVFAGLLLLCPFQVSLTRAFGVGVLVVFHLSVMLLFHLGLFPLVGILGLVALLPSGVWSRKPFFSLQRRWGAVENDLRRVSQPTAGLCALFLILVLLSNAQTRPEGPAFRLPRPVEQLTSALRLQQHWDLFSPIPPYNGTFQILDSGSGAVLTDIPSQDSFRGHRWRMLMISSLYPRFALVRRGVANCLAPSGSEVVYQFRVSLVDETGASKPFTIWKLWQGIPLGISP